MDYLADHWLGIIFSGYTVFWLFTDSFCNFHKKRNKALESEGLDYHALDLYCDDCRKRCVWRLGIFALFLILSIIINWHSFSDVVKGDIVKLVILFSAIFVAVYFMRKR